MPVATHTTNVYVDPNLTQTENFLNLLRHHNYVNTDYFGDIEEISPFSRSKTVAGATFNTEVWVHVTPNSPLHFKQKSSYSKTWYNRVPLSNTFVDYDPNNKETWPIFRYEEGTYGDFTGESENDNMILYKIANNLTCFSQDTRFPFSATTEENNTVLVITASGASPCYHGSVKIRLELPYIGPGILVNDFPGYNGNRVYYIHRNALPGTFRDGYTFKDGQAPYLTARMGSDQNGRTFYLVPVDPNRHPTDLSPTLYLTDRHSADGTPSQIRGDVSLPNGVRASNRMYNLPNNPTVADHPRKLRAFETQLMKKENQQFTDTQVNYPFSKAVNQNDSFSVYSGFYQAINHSYRREFWYTNGYNEAIVTTGNLNNPERYPAAGLLMAIDRHKWETRYFDTGEELNVYTSDKVIPVLLPTILRNYFMHTNASARSATVVSNIVDKKYSETTYRGDATVSNPTLRQLPHRVHQSSSAEGSLYFESVNETSTRLPTGVNIHQRNDDEVVEIEVSVKNPLHVLDLAAFEAKHNMSFNESIARNHIGQSGAVNLNRYQMPIDGIGIRIPFVEFRLPDHPRDTNDANIWQSEQAMISFFTHEFREYLYTMFFDKRPVNSRTPTRTSIEGFNEDYKSLKVQFVPLAVTDNIKDTMHAAANAENMFGKDDNVRMWRVTYPDVANHPFIKGSLLVRCFKNT